MEIANLDRDLNQIAELRSSINDPKNEASHQDLKQTLSSLEKKFLDTYGHYLEEAIKDVHDEVCPDDQVAPLTSYLAGSYIDTGNRRGGMKVFEVENNEGVGVGVDDYPGKDTKLVILPNPCRIMLIVGDTEREELWRARSN